MLPICAVALIVVAVVTPVTNAFPQYKIDLSWPSTDLRALGINRVTAVAVEAVRGQPPLTTRIHVAQRELAYPYPIVILDPINGTIIGRYGHDAIANTTSAGWGIHGLKFNDMIGSGIAATDNVDFTVKMFDDQGHHVDTLGTPGKAGNSTSPMQFGNVADIAFSINMDANGARFMFVADGDGGVNNRISAFINGNKEPNWVAGNASAGTGPLQFSSPHSIAWHEPTSTCIVADRGNNRTQLLRCGMSGHGGQYFGEWNETCVGTPWGVRIVSPTQPPYQASLFIADGTNQRVRIVSFNGMDPYTGKAGDCKVLQTIDIDKKHCEVPHEMGVDTTNGYVYLACVGNTYGNVMRLVPVYT